MYADFAAGFFVHICLLQSSVDSIIVVLTLCQSSSIEMVDCGYHYCQHYWCDSTWHGHLVGSEAPIQWKRGQTVSDWSSHPASSALVSAAVTIFQSCLFLPLKTFTPTVYLYYLTTWKYAEINIHGQLAIFKRSLKTFLFEQITHSAHWGRSSCNGLYKCTI